MGATLHIDFCRRPMADNTVVSGEVLLKFEVIQAVIVALVTCKNKEDPFKNEGG